MNGKDAIMAFTVIFLLATDIATFSFYSTASTSYNILANDSARAISSISRLNNSVYSTFVGPLNLALASYLSFESDLFSVAGILMGFYAVVFVEILKNEHYQPSAVGTMTLPFFMLASIMLFAMSIHFSSAGFVYIANSSANLYKLNSTLHALNYSTSLNVSSTVRNATSETNRIIGNLYTSNTVSLFFLLISLDIIIIVLVNYGLNRFNQIM